MMSHTWHFLATPRCRRGAPAVAVRAVAGAVLAAASAMFAAADSPAVAEEIVPRPACIFLPVEDGSQGAESRYLAGVIGDGLQAELVRQGAFRMIERGQLRSLLEEDDLRAAGVVDGRLRQKLGADLVIASSYRDEGGVVTVHSRLIDAATSEVLRQAQWSGHVSSLADAMPPQVAAALAGNAPPPVKRSEAYDRDFARACRALDQGQADRAVDIANRLLDEHPDDIAVLLVRGHAGLVKKGWGRYAVKDFEKVLALDADNLAAQLGLARAELAGDRRAAQAALTRLAEILSTHPNHAETLWLTAESYEKSGDTDAVLRFATQAAEALPEFSPAWQTLARAHLYREDWSEAVSAARHATVWAPQSASAHLLLGDAELAAGGRESARQAFEYALRCDPPPETRRLLEARLRNIE